MLQYVTSYLNIPIFCDLVFKVFCLFLLLKFYQWITWGKCKCPDLMMGKTVLITGASSGIGKETARNLARRGARVLIACRNVAEGEKTKEEICNETGNVDVHVFQLDVSSFQSVRKLTGYLNRTERCLDVLIHNAGVVTSEPMTTRDGLELTMATNHYGPFLLTHLLIDLMKKAAQGRIIVVTSGFYYLSCMYDLLNNPNPVDHFFPAMLYPFSSYANIYFTLELARRLKGTEITANCVHPGIVHTAFFKKVLEDVRLYARIFYFLFSKTPEQGAQSVIHLAVNEDVRRETGKYFADCRIQGLTKRAVDAEYARNFWCVSERLVGSQRGDPRSLA